MTEEPQITDAERLIMEALWESSPRSSRDIIQAVQAHTDWQAKTIQTLISRLAGKAMLHHDSEGRRFLYSPAISREDFLRRKSRTFVQTFFQGKVTPLVAAFAEQESLSPDDVQQLRAFIDSLDKQTPGESQ